ncbi:MAG TPA: HIT family protein [Vicinamibacterales bacterium]|jgi:diadenosine tetraphosphate (Ap4A) HIT family hydrolase|nr:HIT family protein [Vicinamibacterales bacterium]
METWKLLFGGTGCPMDAPRPDKSAHWDLIAPLAISSLYLSKNQTYRGHCQLIFDGRHACQLEQLTLQEYRAFTDDLFAAQRAVMRTVHPDHINVEVLGNVVPHLHWHIVPRYFSDPRWGMPIWATPLSAMPDTRLPEAEHASLIEAIRLALTH